MNIVLGLLIVALIYIGIEYGTLVFEHRRQQKDDIYTPTRYIMIKTRDGNYIDDLAQLDIDAHKAAGVEVEQVVRKHEQGYTKTIFLNKDELVVYDYNEAQILPLTQLELNNYNQKIFFDYKLPKGAERAIIQQLGLLNYMVNIGICSEKSGGK